jgi:hypothetical protein
VWGCSSVFAIIMRPTSTMLLLLLLLSSPTLQ